MEIRDKKIKLTERDRKAFLSVIAILSVVILLFLIPAAIDTGGTIESVEINSANQENLTAQMDSAKDPLKPRASAEVENNIEPKETEDIDTEGITEEEETAEPTGDSVSKEDEDVESLLNKMTLEEKVAQLFFVTPEELTGYDQVTRFGDVSKEALLKYPVGGLIYFKDNLTSAGQTKEMLSQTQEFATENTNIPIFLGVDEEGGSVLRIGDRAGFGVPKVGSMKSVSEKGGADAVREAAATIGAYLYDYGFNVDFAPVVDVLTNESNTVIGDRSFGSDPEFVSEMSIAYAEGLHSAGVLSTYKHFPGHGGTAEDTHKGYAYNGETLDDLMKNDLLPYANGAGSSADFVMVSHISLPNVTGSDIPASLSADIVEGILRDKLHYDGIVITDALNMGAVSEHYSSADAAVLALEAGCDMILMPGNLEKSYSAVLDAVAAGRISEDRIDESVQRILSVKMEQK